MTGKKFSFKYFLTFWKQVFCIGKFFLKEYLMQSFLVTIRQDSELEEDDETENAPLRSENQGYLETLRMTVRNLLSMKLK